MKIKALGKTVDDNGEVRLIMLQDMPADCFVLFMNRESYQEILEAFGDKSIKREVVNE